MVLYRCSYCNKEYPSKRDFFLCWNCSSLECTECATERLFNNRDFLEPNFIGICQNCNVKWGFFNISPLERLNLAAQKPMGKMHLQMGLTGPVFADIWFLGLEIDAITEECTQLTQFLFLAYLQHDIWMNTLKDLQNNYKRIEISQKYIIEKYHSNFDELKDGVSSLPNIDGSIYQKTLITAHIFNRMLERVIRLLLERENLSNFHTKMIAIYKMMEDSKEFFDLNQRKGLFNLTNLKRLHRKTSLKKIGGLLRQIILGFPEDSI